MCWSDIGNLSWLESSRSASGGHKVPVARHTDAAGDDSDAVVMVNGALVNVNNVLHKLRKSDEQLAQTENELKNMEQDCGAFHF